MKTKSRLVGIFLTLLLGPLGVFYSNVTAAVVLILISISTGGIALFITWPLSVFICDSGVMAHNDKLLMENKRHDEILDATLAMGQRVSNLEQSA